MADKFKKGDIVEFNIGMFKFSNLECEVLAEKALNALLEGGK